MQIRKLKVGEVPLLRDFAPPDWNTDLPGLFGRHFGQPYFHPIAAELDDELVGCAQGLVQGNAGWLGNIIVLPGFRGRGIGTALTEALVQFHRQRHVRSQILIATSMGEPIYLKLGFKIRSQYVFFAREGTPPSATPVPGLRAMTSAQQGQVFALDEAATGESRRPFLQRYLDGAYVHIGRSGNADGYYLPGLRDGLIIGSSDAAGLVLLQHKLNQGATSAVVPEHNRAAVHFLLDQGFVETARAARMTLGPDVDWQPRRVFCRGAGYCG
jgi:GNAT superfamily N-acetyltransferase